MMFLRLCTIAILSVVSLTGCGQDITLPATGTVYGDLLYTDGTPAAGIVAMVEGYPNTAVSDENGRFVINGVLAVDEQGMGRYYVVRGYGERDGNPVGFIVDHFKVKGQQSYSVGIVVVRQTGSITGAIYLEIMSDHSGVFVGIEGTSIETVTRADGSFFLDQVPAHEGYRKDCTRSGFHPMTIESFWDNGEQRPLRVDPRETTDIGATTLSVEL